MQEGKKDKNDCLMTFDFTDNTDIKKHFHSAMELFYVLEGEAEIYVEDEVFSLKRDDFLLVNTNKTHAISGRKPFFAGYIHINYQKVCDYLGSEYAFFICCSANEHSEVYGELRTMIRKIFKQYFEQKSIYRVYLESLYHQLLFKLVNTFLIYQEHPKFEKLYGSDDERRICFIAEYMESRYAEKITLSEFAEKLYFSESYVSRYMKQKFGMTFVEYLNEIRLHHAVEDMLTTNKSLTRVAMDNGFANTAVFNRAFKKTYEMLPSEYKKKWKHSRQKEVSRQNREKENFAEKVKQYIEWDDSGTERKGMEGRKQISADVLLTEPFFNSSKIMNIGTAENLLASNIQKQIILLKSTLDFTYARFWGLYSKEMYLIIDLEKRKFNFNKIDRVLDFLISNGMRPFIEIGMKPMQIIKTLDEYMVYQEPDIDFPTPGDYAVFVQAFIIHCINRYGEKEVAAWYLEYWFDARNVSAGEFWEYFAAARDSVKSCLKEIRFGGAGFNMSKDQSSFKKFIRKWKSTGVKPDFISLNSYHYIPYAKNGENGVMDKKWKRSADSRYLYNQILTAKETMLQEEVEVPELYMTEWNLTNSSREIMNDSCFKGAYILKNVMDTIGCVELMGYWTMLDAFSEHYDSTEVLDGSGGILTRDGILKPAYYAFEFMKNMGSQKIMRNENCLITTDGYQNYYIVCHNYKNLSFQYYMKAQDEIDIRRQEQLFEEYGEQNIGLRLEHLKNGTYRSQTRLINMENGSVLDEWVRMGKPENMKREEMEYLKQVSVPRILVEQYEVKDGALTLQMHLAPNEIRFIQIEYIR